MNYFILSIFLTFSLFSQDLPKWVFQTEDDKYIYGVGSASKQKNFQQQLRIAKMLARANLSENISVEVSTMFEKNFSNNQKDINYNSIQKSKNLLKYSSIHKKWISKNGELFILIAVKK